MKAMIERKAYSVTPARDVELADGPIDPQCITESIRRRQEHMQDGAHSIFLGQVRADTVNGIPVRAILYEAYTAMAEARLRAVADGARQRFGLGGISISHSVGTVRAGEVSLFVMASAPHRRAAQAATHWVVEEIKRSVPVWKRLLLADGSFHWNEEQKITDYEGYQP